LNDFVLVMEPHTLPSLLQFSDGLFPAGGFAHSFGLESFVQSGSVRNADNLRSFIETYLEGAAGPCDAVAVVAAMKFTGKKAIDRCLELDRTLEAMKPVAEFRAASRQMGRQSLRIAVNLFSCPLLSAVFECAEADRTPAHHALVFGLIGRRLGWPPEAAATAYLYATASMLVGAALRLLPLGQLEGQRVLWQTAPTIQRLAREAIYKDAGDLWSFIPAIEIAGMKHATLAARLFRS
jgi:urease accessory protein